MIRPVPPAFDAVVLHDLDNIGTALHFLESGVVARVKSPAGDFVLTVCDCIPACHKFSLQALELGCHVRKHGMVIGHATAAIAPGAHVHTHNLIGRGPHNRDFTSDLIAG